MKLGIINLILAIVIASCGGDKSSGEGAALPLPDLRARRDEASRRLLQDFTQGAYVVSRYLDGRPEHLGEGILWSSLAMGYLPCDAGKPLVAALLEMATRRAGEIVRIEPLAQYANGRELNFDGETGFMAGVATRAARCGVSDELRALWRLRLGALERHGGRLHPNTSETLIAEFTYLRDAVTHKMGLGEKPSPSRARVLAAQTSGWAAAVVAKKAAGYRIHLAWLYHEALRRLGYDPRAQYFCAATRGSGIEIVEHFCGRGDLAAWTRRFAYDRYEYAWQRAKWERPDGRDGLRTPGLDLVMALTTLIGD